jgi:hypothetical protein
MRVSPVLPSSLLLTAVSLPGIALLAALPARAASVTVDVTTSLFPDGTSAPGRFRTDSTTAAAGLALAGLNETASGNRGARLGTANGVGTASAGFGVLRLTASASAAENFNTNRNQAAQGNVSVSAAFEDEFSFVAPLPALTGTRGTATLTWAVTGASALGTCGTCVASTDWTVGTSITGITRFVGNTSDTVVREFRDINGSPPVGAFPGRPLSVTIEFNFGDLLTLGQEARANPAVLAFSTGSPGPLATIAADVDLGSTVQWLGIADLRDAQGNALTCAVASTSGTDWCAAVAVTPVPLPASAAFLATNLAGFAVFAGWRRRPRRRPTAPPPEQLPS